MRGCIVGIDAVSLPFWRTKLVIDSAIAFVDPDLDVEFSQNTE